MDARGAGIDAYVPGRRFQTDARAKPAHPEVGTASGASVAQAGAGIDAYVPGRRFQTDARAKPAHPEVGTASGASVAQALTSVSEIERKLASLRMDSDCGARQRTSVMTHIAWVPEEWVEAAEDV